MRLLAAACTLPLQGANPSQVQLHVRMQRERELRVQRGFPLRTLSAARPRIRTLRLQSRTLGEPSRPGIAVFAALLGGWHLRYRASLVRLVVQLEFAPPTAAAWGERKTEFWVIKQTVQIKQMSWAHNVQGSVINWMYGGRILI